MNVRDVPWWGSVSSAAPPVVLAAGWMIAASLQSRPYDPVADTVSALAGTGTIDRWVMTLAFAMVGACEIVTGLALRPARTAGRLVLTAGGIAGVLVAEFPVHMGDGAPGSHVLWATAGLVALLAWSAWNWSRRPGRPGWRSACSVRRSRPGRSWWSCPPVAGNRSGDMDYRATGKRSRAPICDGPSRTGQT